MFDKVSQMIEDRLRLNWVDTKVDYDGLPFTPVIGTSWIREQLSWSSSKLIAGTSDGGTYRERGLITISVFTPSKIGSRQNLILCSKVANIFRGWASDKLTMEEPYNVRAGEEKEWFGYNVYIPFYYDNCFQQTII